MLPPLATIAPFEEALKAKREPESIQGRAGEAWANVGQNYGSPDMFGGLSWINLVGQAADEIIPWSWYPYRRDIQLRQFARAESILAGAIYSIRSRTEALPYKIEGGPRAKKFYSDVIGTADLGGGAKQLIGKTVYDLLTQDNGAFWELVGAGKPDGQRIGPVTQINHIDANRCWRTFDPEFPVIYYNPYTAAFHKMHQSRIVIMSDNTMPDEIARGIGFCATSRALRSVQIMRDISIFKHEKISGNFTRAMLILQGFTTKQVDAAKQVADEGTEAAGLTYFRNIPVLTSMKDKISHELIDFASLPDGFDTEKDTNLYVYVLALAFGVDAREFWPATSSGATKGDAGIQHMKAQGKGLASIIQTIEHAFNWQALKDVIEFSFDSTDDAMELMKAQVVNLKIQNLGLLQTQGLITPQQGFKVAVAEGLLDPDPLQSSEAPAPVDSGGPVQTMDPNAKPQTTAPQAGQSPAQAPVQQPAAQQAAPAKAQPTKPAAAKELKGNLLPSDAATLVPTATMGDVQRWERMYKALKEAANV